MQHTDLSLQSTSEGTTIHHIKVGADSICDFRKLFGDNIGVAFKSKKFPKVSSKEIKYLQVGDKINIIEYTDRVEGNDNYLELTFDEINNCLKFNIKCSTMIAGQVGSNAAFRTYINRVAPYWTVEVGTVLTIDNKRWKVTSRRGEQCTVTTAFAPHVTKEMSAAECLLYKS